MKRLITFSRIVILFAILTAPAYAALPTDVSGIVEKGGLLDRMAGYVSDAFWIATAIAIFYAGFLYLTAGQSEEKVSKAHKYLLYAVIGIAVGLFAYGMPELVKSILGG